MDNIALAKALSGSLFSVAVYVLLQPVFRRRRGFARPARTLKIDGLAWRYAHGMRGLARTRILHLPLRFHVR